MGLFATYELRCSHLPLVDVAAAVPDADLSVSLVASADGPIPLVVHLADGPADAVEREFDAAAFVDTYTVLGADDGTRRYKVRPAVGLDAYWTDELDDVAELRALADTDSEIQSSEVRPWGWVQRGWFADREVLARFREFWSEQGGFVLRRLTPEDAGGAAGLTDRQREALVTAHEMGYFEVPRRASLADVAAELGVGTSALSERLRRAHAHLVATVVRHSDAVTN
jgi:predicted DNA binding protein